MLQVNLAHNIQHWKMNSAPPPQPKFQETFKKHVEKVQIHKILNDKGEITALREPLKMTEIYANDLET